MLVQTKIAKVWNIRENELNCSNKRIVTINYNDVEIAILKEEQNYAVQEFLIKDKNNEYWKLGIAPIRFNLFLDNKEMDEEERKRIMNYRKDIIEVYKQLDLKAFWNKKIVRNDYFNKCELKYIEKYYPDIYDKAKESRKIFEENRDKKYEQERFKRKQKEQNEVKKTNDIFRNQVRQMKYKIFIGATVEVENLKFYKDDKFENGKTIQNNILYLAKQYGIKIPSATQGFIKNRLVSYNFKSGEILFREIKSNKRCSTKMLIYLRELYIKVIKEYKEKLNSKTEKTKQKEISI